MPFFDNPATITDISNVIVPSDTMAKFGNSVAVFFVASLATGSLAPVGAASAQTAEPISVSLTDYAFTPAAINLKASVTYRVHFVNAGSKNHNFAAPEFFAASLVAPEDQTKVKGGTVAVDSGQAVDVAMTPGRAGTYAFTCTHFMHNMMGMHGKIIVQ